MHVCDIHPERLSLLPIFLHRVIDTYTQDEIRLPTVSQSPFPRYQHRMSNERSFDQDGCEEMNERTVGKPEEVAQELIKKLTELGLKAHDSGIQPSVFREQ